MLRCTKLISISAPERPPRKPSAPFCTPIFRAETISNARSRKAFGRILDTHSVPHSRSTKVNVVRLKSLENHKANLAWVRCRSVQKKNLDGVLEITWHSYLTMSCKSHQISYLSKHQQQIHCLSLSTARLTTLALKGSSGIQMMMRTCRLTRPVLTSSTKILCAQEIVGVRIALTQNTKWVPLCSRTNLLHNSMRMRKLLAH